MSASTRWGQPKPRIFSENGSGSGRPGWGLERLGLRIQPFPSLANWRMPICATIGGVLLVDILGDVQQVAVRHALSSGVYSTALSIKVGERLGRVTTA